ncbi:hypothetical protein TRAPUB_6848 [Trametes pubescens]|uniref:Uncharacterized protein n=1 Tax=Trametes pubescens TaxID=154538 RepID=A0A1M2V4U5_TRAPU|nr:hypothetical protein TRAPUB_6848 [Trametes pubescens]
MQLTTLVSLVLALVLTHIGPATGSLTSRAQSHALYAIVCISDADCADCPGSASGV